MGWGKTLVAATALATIATESALAEGLQFQCGALKGMAFQSDQGWYEDGISKGETVIRIDLDSGSVDVRFKDYFQVWQSVTDSGGKARIFTVQSEPAAIMVQVEYPRVTVELLTLTDISKDSALLVQTVSRVMGEFITSRIMTANCLVNAF